MFKAQTHKWLIVFFRAARVLVGFAVRDAAARLALPVGASVCGWLIYFHRVDWAHANRDARFDVAVGWKLLIHGFVFGFGDALVRDGCTGGMVSHDKET
jgi:uncharacterized membrane protein YedE/YeeE